MVRLALLLVILLAVPMARADDEDGVLETPPLGQAIPERVEELEREWADDVGLQEPPDPTRDDTDADADAAEPAVDPTKDDPREPVKARPVDETPRPAPRSALRRPRDEREREARHQSLRPAACPLLPSRPEWSGRATDED